MLDAPARALFCLAAAAGSVAVLGPAPAEEAGVVNHWALEAEGERSPPRGPHRGLPKLPAVGQGDFEDVWLSDLSR